MADTTSQILFQNIDHSLMHNSFSFETSSLKLYKFHNLDKFYIIEVILIKSILIKKIIYMIIDYC